MTVQSVTPSSDMNSNLFTTLRHAYEERPDTVFLRTPGGDRSTYAMVDDRSAHMAGALTELGVGVGDRVVAQVEKSPDDVALYLACLRMGAVFLPLNTAYTATEVAYFVQDAEAAIVVAQPGTLDDLTLDGSTAQVVHLGVDGDGDFAERTDAADPLLEVAVRGPDDLAAMLYTSGTTGKSKGAMLTHANLASNAITLHEFWGFDHDDVLLHTLPIFHVHGLFVALHCAMLGANEVVFLPRFDVDDVLEHLPGSTVMMGVPTQYTRLLADDRFDAERCAGIRLFTSGSAPMTAAVHDEFTSRTGHSILERYGMTEAGMITSNPYDGERVAGTVGHALPGVELRIADDDGEEVGLGTTGVVEIRSPGLCAGYWGMAEKTAAAHRPGGWFITGDVGSVDDTGRLTLEGRSSDMIISGGLNIYPKEIEMVLDAVPGVLESAVVGVPHPDFGEAVVAIVVREKGSTTTDADLSRSIGGVLARFKHPRVYIEADELPRNAMAKIQKATLRSQHALIFTEE